METAALQASRIEVFARDVLGCQCPAEVFRKVRVDGNISAAGLPLRRRIVIGDRLLIYLVDAAELPAGDTGVVMRLCRAGVDERDALGLNRFRLVLAGSATGEAAAPELPDERCHLHHVSTQEVERACA